MADQNISDDAAGLAKLVKHVNFLTPLCPPNFQSDSNKICFSRHAVLEKSWAERATSNITTTNFTFSTFVTALREQLQLQREKKEQSSTFQLHFARKMVGITGCFFNKLDQEFNMSPIGRGDIWMLYKWCGSDEHFTENCVNKSKKNFLSKKLQCEAPVVHTFQGPASRINSINFLTLGETSDTHDTALVSKAPSDLAKFDALEEPKNGTALNDDNLFQKLDETAATHQIKSSMKNLFCTSRRAFEKDFQ